VSGLAEIRKIKQNIPEHKNEDLNKKIEPERIFVVIRKRYKLFLVKAFF